MKKLQILSLIIIAALGDVAKTEDFAFKWKSSALFPNGTVVQACVGDNVTFPWVFDMTSPKQVVIQWSKISENKPDRQKLSVLAKYNRNTFHGLSTKRDLEFLPNAGIKLPKVTLADKGFYTVEIILFGHPESYKQVAILHVSDVPVITSDELHAFILHENVCNSANGQWYFQLGCRPPVTRGQSALPVIWTTPSNRTAISTSYNNNTFILALPSPMEEGDYSCFLNWSVPAVKCLSTRLNAHRAATVNVKGVNTRLSYFDRSVETLWIETANLNGSLCNLSDIVQHLQTNDKNCDEEINSLNQTTENINSVLQNLQTENDKMTSKINYLESITATAQFKYDNMSVMVLNKFDNLTDVIQRKNGSMTALVQSKIDGITSMVQKNNINITALVQRKFDNITVMVQRNNDNITVMVQRNNDNIKAMVQKHNDNITAMIQNIPVTVQRNNSITAMVQSKFDDIKAMVQRNNESITAKVQSKFDNIIGIVQSKFDDITAMVQSKFDNVNAIVLQVQSGFIQLQGMDYGHRPASCVDVQKYDNLNGVHTLIVNDNRYVKVFCDQSTDNGGWTVIQRRQDGSVDFYRNWEQYEKGFGDLNGEFWIGLANVYRLTKSRSVKLRVDLRDFHGSSAYAVYNTFSISGADDNYRLNVGRYSGNAGDSLAAHNKMKFSTFDRDHDTWSGNCAQDRHGAWWYAVCADSNLNGRYKTDGASGTNGVTWERWKSDWRSFKRVEMKIKE